MKLTFFSESKSYDQKESYLTKYYRMRSKLKVFLFKLRSPLIKITKMKQLLINT